MMSLETSVKNGRWFFLLGAILQGMAYLLPISRVDIVGAGTGPIINYLYGEPENILGMAQRIYKYGRVYGSGASDLQAAV